MKKPFNFCLIIVLLLPFFVGAEEQDSLLDDNTAFYSGNHQSYIIPAPPEFKMLIDEAYGDGYSFAFIPTRDGYDSAEVRIGINIYRVKDESRKKFSLQKLVEGDTTALRLHFGKQLMISLVDSIEVETGQFLQTYYLNDTTSFIPNVMLAYFDGGGEVLIFELSIDDSYPRFLAEKIYVACLGRIKILAHGSLGAG